MRAAQSAVPGHVGRRKYAIHSIPYPVVPRCWTDSTAGSAGVAVHQLEIEINRRHAAGTLVSTRRVALKEILPPAGQLAKRTDVGLFQSNQPLRNLQVFVAKPLPFE